jgi:hypothetical protein
MQYCVLAEKKIISRFGKKRKYLMCVCNFSSTPRWMFVVLEFLFPYILCRLVHLKQQGESNYKCNRCCYFDVFLHLLLKILHICFGVQIEKKQNGG